MMQAFTCNLNPARIVFGQGTLAKVAEEIRGQGCARALILSTPFQEGDAQALAAQLGDLAAGVFSQAAMHTPVSVTQQAVEAYDRADADCVVALGGGSTIGLGKAIAYRKDCPQIVVATTYAGSEVTPILGQTEDGLKTTFRDTRVLPEVVIYDPDLTLGLPVAMSVTSGLNAMAHAVEAVYAQDRNPVSSLQAVEGVRALRDALMVIVEDPRDITARTQALYGSWLCGNPRDHAAAYGGLQRARGRGGNPASRRLVRRRSGVGAVGLRQTIGRASGAERSGPARGGPGQGRRSGHAKPLLEPAPGGTPGDPGTAATRLGGREANGLIQHNRIREETRCLQDGNF